MRPTRPASLVLAAFVLALGTASVHAQEKYAVDPVHSFVVFKIGHLNASYVWGRFNEPGGTFVLDANNPQNMSCDITVQVDKVDTGNPRRDTHLKSPDFFDAKQFPEIKFTSKGAKKTGESKYEVTGDFTCHGVTKSVTLPYEIVGSGPGMRPGTQVTGVAAQFTIKRSDFGMTGMSNVAGDEVMLFVNLEGGKQ